MMDPSWILLSWIQPFCTKLWLKLIQSDWNSFILTQIDDVSHLEFCLLLISHFEQKKSSLIHSHSTWWCQPSWILPSSSQPFWTKKNITHSFSLNVMMAAILNSIILDSAILHKKTLLIHPWLILMMAAILNSAMLDSDTAILDSAILRKTLTQTNPIWFKLIHSHSTWWCQPSWILSFLDSAILHKKNFTHSSWLILMMAAILNSAMLDSDTAILDSAILHKTLTQTNPIWFKLIHSHSTWWCQASCILPSWIQAFWTNKNFTHSFSLNLRMSAILNSAFL